MAVVISKSHYAHRLIAVRASKHWSGTGRLRPDNDVQDQLDQHTDFFRIPVQKSIFAQPPEPVWQDMLKKETQKLFSLKSPFLHCSGSAVPISERHLAVGVGDDVFFSDHASVQIPCEVFQGRGACAHMATVNNPLLRRIARDL